MSAPAPDPRNLNPREREVLGKVVELYIRTGVPVGSRTLSKVNTEGLSPATLRSIMADLEEAGYLSHPHTSAGRIPTDVGYRFHVDSLAGRPKLAATEREAMAREFHATGGLDSLVSRCTRLLAAASHQLSVATLPDVHCTTYRHVEFVKLSPRRLLVLFVASSGVVHQQVIKADLPDTQVELERQARFLNAELEGRTLMAVRDRLAELMREDRAAYDALARRALTLGSQYFAGCAESEGEVVVGGAEQLLERPDLADFDRMKQLLSAIEDKHRMLRILTQCLGRHGMTTAIGAENQDPQLRDCSLVATSYGVPGGPAGALAIIGPTRMDYDRAMALVGYVAELLGSALAPSQA